MNLRKSFWSHPGNGSREKSESFGEWNCYLFAGRAGRKKLGFAFRAEANHAKIEQSSRHTAERDPCGQKVSVWQVESQSVRGKLPFLRWLALYNANRAGRIAFTNCFPDW